MTVANDEIRSPITGSPMSAAMSSDAATTPPTKALMLKDLRKRPLPNHTQPALWLHSTKLALKCPNLAGSFRGGQTVSRGASRGSADQSDQ